MTILCIHVHVHVTILCIHLHVQVTDGHLPLPQKMGPGLKSGFKWSCLDKGSVMHLSKLESANVVSLAWQKEQVVLILLHVDPSPQEFTNLANSYAIRRYVYLLSSWISQEKAVSSTSRNNRPDDNQI